MITLSVFAKFYIFKAITSHYDLFKIVSILQKNVDWIGRWVKRLEFIGSQ